MTNQIKKTVFASDWPVVQTAAGQILGCVVDEVYTFRGVEYATAGRYQPPQKPQPWTGIREATVYGDTCPSGILMESTIYSTHRSWKASESCQNLNIWSPEFNAEARLPVMVWLHGGGYSSGSSIDEAVTDGIELARHGEVVVVSVNHRLNVLGFLDLSAFGERFIDSGNLGMADIIAALAWVRENIAQFGGDPDNVTLFGQSGGGGKIMTLMQMPAADGLYHRAIIQSGVMTLQQNMTKARQFGRKTAKLLGLTPSTIDEICNMPFNKISQAAQTVAQYPGFDMPMGLMSLAPVNDGKNVLGNYLDAGFRDEVRSIPIMVGSCIGELALFSPSGLKKPIYPEVNKDLISREDKIDCLRRRFGEDTDAVVEAFSKAYPEIDIIYAIDTDSMVRIDTLRYAAARAQASSADVYCYLMTYRVKARGGKLAWHGADLPFVFGNAAKSEIMCTGGDEILPLMTAMRDAWSGFARYGKPMHDLMPSWPPFTEEIPATMLFDTTCRVAIGHDRDLLPKLAEKTGGEHER